MTTDPEQKAELGLAVRNVSRLAVGDVDESHDHVAQHRQRFVDAACLLITTTTTEFLRCLVAYQSMVEPPQRPSAGAMGHHPRCFAGNISSLKGAITKKIIIN